MNVMVVSLPTYAPYVYGESVAAGGAALSADLPDLGRKAVLKTWSSRIAEPFTRTM